MSVDKKRKKNRRVVLKEERKKKGRGKSDSTPEATMRWDTYSILDPYNCPMSHHSPQLLECCLKVALIQGRKIPASFNARLTPEGGCSHLLTLGLF